MAGGQGGIDHGVMPHFLVEFHLADAGDLELERAVRILRDAQERVAEPAPGERLIIAGISRGDGRLVCLIEATSLVAARRTVAVALLPPGRIREIRLMAGSGLFGTGDPRGDADPGAESELVEDVVDMRLDRPLGQE